MSVRHEKCGVYFLTKNFEWKHEYFNNDLAADSAMTAAAKDTNLVYVGEDFGQCDSWFDTVEKAAKEGKTFRQIDQALEDEE